MPSAHGAPTDLSRSAALPRGGAQIPSSLLQREKRRCKYPIENPLWAAPGRSVYPMPFLGKTQSFLCDSFAGFSPPGCLNLLESKFVTHVRKAAFADKTQSSFVVLVLLDSGLLLLAGFWPPGCSSWLQYMYISPVWQNRYIRPLLDTMYDPD